MCETPKHCIKNINVYEGMSVCQLSQYVSARSGKYLLLFFLFLYSGKKEVGEKKRRRKRKEKQIDSEAGDVDKEESAEDGSSDEMEEDIEKLKVTDSPSETMETTNESTTAAPPGVVHTDSVFTVTIGPQGGSSVRSVEGGDGCVCSAPFVPRARMNSMLAVKNGVLYMYGGLYEEGDKQLTLSDIYSLDLRKLDEWHTLISDDTARQVSSACN